MAYPRIETFTTTTLRKGTCIFMATFMFTAGAYAAKAQPRRARAQATQPAPQPRFTTPDGAVVLVEENHDLPLVDVDFVLRTGSLHDPAGKEGLARFVARLCRMGTRSLRANAVEDGIDGLGAQLSIEASPSYIRFEGAVIKRNLGRFVELLARLVTEPAFRAADLAQVQRETVADIVETRDNDRALAAQRFRRALFGEHPYGRPVIGTTRSVRAITRDDVRAFYEAHFVARNVVLAFAGDVTRAEVEELVSVHFGALRDGAAPRDTATDPTAPLGRRVVVVDKPERTQTQIYIGTLGTRADDPDHFALLVANTVFGGTFTARLMKAVRSERGWSYGASSRLAVDRLREAFYMWTFPSARDAVPCIQLELDLLSRFVRAGITQAELDFAKSYLTNSYAFDVDTAADRLDQRIDVEVLGLPADYYSRYLERISAVTLSQANAAVRRRLTADTFTIAVVATASDVLEALRALPTAPEVTVVPFDAE